jgi:hypothetical protein
MFEAEAAAVLVAVVVVEEDAGGPYCASVLESIEMRRSRENDKGAMVDIGCVG